MSRKNVSDIQKALCKRKVLTLCLLSGDKEAIIPTF